MQTVQNRRAFQAHLLCGLSSDTGPTVPTKRQTEYEPYTHQMNANILAITL